MSDNKLDSRAMIYCPFSEFGAGEAKVLEIKWLTTIDGDMTDEFDLVAGDLIMLP